MDCVACASEHVANAVCGIDRGQQVAPAATCAATARATGVVRRSERIGRADTGGHLPADRGARAWRICILGGSRGPRCGVWCAVCLPAEDGRASCTSAFAIVPMQADWGT